MANAPKVLLILDGYGLNEKTEGNAVAQAKTPVMDKLMKESEYDAPASYVVASYSVSSYIQFLVSDFFVVVVSSVCIVTLSAIPVTSSP